MQISVKDLLACDFFAAALLLAGKNGLSNLVTSVTVLDSPDAPKYLRGGELVVTTAYSLLNDEEAQKEVVAQLAKNGAAGLGIKLRFFQNQLPEVMQKTAERLNFPIIAIPDEYAYTDIYEFVTSNFISKVTGEVKHDDEVMQEINESLYREGLEGIVKALYKWTGLQTLLKQGSQVYSYPEENYAPEIPLDPVKWRKQGTNKGKLYNIESYYFQRNDIHYEWIAVSLLEEHKDLGFIMLFKGDRDFVKDDYILLENAASVCGVELKRLQSLVEVQRKYRKDFLEKLFAGNYTWEEAKYRASELQYDLPAYGVVMVVSFDPKVINVFNDQDIARVESIVSDVYGWRTLFGLPGKDNLVVYLPDDKEKYLPLAETLYKKLLQAFPSAEIVIGIGRGSEFDEISKSYQEAKNAITIGSCLDLNPKIYDFSDLGFYRLLKLPDVKQEMIKYYEDYLKPLRVNDSPDENLINTLSCFIESNYNYSDTAKKMYIHPNTVRYRISVIEKMCRVNLKYAYDRLNMEIALKILPLIEPIHHD
ncbi:MAG: hypothetical protein GX262_08315 [Clostridia bacterium]|jgi:purine catabolism regulator|nr:hypothetical protein [Clostridia bacterium]